MMNCVAALPMCKCELVSRDILETDIAKEIPPFCRSTGELAAFHDTLSACVGDSLHERLLEVGVRERRP